jgi:hypothetical protein
MELPIPAWFKYRQGQASPSGDNSYQLTAPLVDPAWIRVRQQDSAWVAALADSADGPDVIATDPKYATAADAWGAAFELYRSAKIC